MSRTTAKKQRDRDARYALTFGLESDAVRQGPCVALRLAFEGPHPVGKQRKCRPRVVTIDDTMVRQWDPAHVVSVGAGGGRFDLVSLCNLHHRQQHDIGIVTFAAMYGLDLRALADAIALAHEPPLGIRGLAARWVAFKAAEAEKDGSSPQWMAALYGQPRGYDRVALMGWTRRRMAADEWVGVSDPGEARCDFAGAIAVDLGFAHEGPDQETAAWALCEQAGWPS